MLWARDQASVTVQLSKEGKMLSHGNQYFSQAMRGPSGTSPTCLHNA